MENAEVLEMTVKRVESILQNKVTGKRVIRPHAGLSFSRLTPLRSETTNVSYRVCDVIMRFPPPQKLTA